jgi:hypothetical protein
MYLKNKTFFRLQYLTDDFNTFILFNNNITRS